jgi:hypothetical protein
MVDQHRDRYDELDHVDPERAQETLANILLIAQEIDELLNYLNALEKTRNRNL